MKNNEVDIVRIIDLEEYGKTINSNHFRAFTKKAKSYSANENYVICIRDTLTHQHRFDFSTLSQLVDNTRTIVGIWIAGDFIIDGDFLPQDGGIYFVEGDLEARNMINHHGLIEVLGDIKVQETIYCYFYAGYVKCARAIAHNIIMNGHSIMASCIESDIYIDQDNPLEKPELSFYIAKELELEDDDELFHDPDLGFADIVNLVLSSLFRDVEVAIDGVSTNVPIFSVDEGYFMECNLEAYLALLSSGGSIRSTKHNRIDLPKIIRESIETFQQSSHTDPDHEPLSESQDIDTSSEDIDHVDMQAVLTTACNFLEAEQVAEFVKHIFPIEGSQNLSDSAIAERFSYLAQPDFKQKVLMVLSYLKDSTPLVFQHDKQVGALYVYDPDKLPVAGILGSNTEAVVLRKIVGKFRLSEGFSLLDIPDMVRSGELPSEAIRYAKSVKKGLG